MGGDSEPKPRQVVRGPFTIKQPKCEAHLEHNLFSINVIAFFSRHTITFLIALNLSFRQLHYK